jgi:hypothetical protein
MSVNDGGCSHSGTILYHHSESSNSAGFTTSLYRQMTNQFSIGLVYRPTILRITPRTEFSYEHLISLDFCWKIRVV